MDSLVFKGYDYIYGFMYASFHFIDFVHIVNDKFFSYSLIRDLSHHSVNSLASELIQVGISFDLGETCFDGFDYRLQFADVTGHKCHMD